MYTDTLHEVAEFLENLDKILPKTSGSLRKKLIGIKNSVSSITQEDLNKIETLINDTDEKY